MSAYRGATTTRKKRGGRPSESDGGNGSRQASTTLSSAMTHGDSATVSQRVKSVVS